MAIVLSTSSLNDNIKSWVEEGTPSDLNIDFTGGTPTSFSKWQLRLIRTGIFVSSLGFDIYYDKAGMSISAFEFEVPSEWAQYLPSINLPDATDTIVSNPGSCLFMSDNTTFNTGSCVIEKQGSLYLVKCKASALWAKRFKGTVTWDNETNYVLTPTP